MTMEYIYTIDNLELEITLALADENYEEALSLEAELKDYRNIHE